MIAGQCMACHLGAFDGLMFSLALQMECEVLNV